MIFAWLREFEFYLPLAALVLLLMWVIRRAKRWRKWLKITVRIFATFILVPSSLLLLLLTGCIFLGKSRSRMIYSPDRKHAIQLDTYDEGATGAARMLSSTLDSVSKTQLSFLGTGSQSTQMTLNGRAILLLSFTIIKMSPCKNA